MPKKKCPKCGLELNPGRPFCCWKTDGNGCRYHQSVNLHAENEAMKCKQSEGKKIETKCEKCGRPKNECLDSATCQFYQIKRLKAENSAMKSAIVEFCWEQRSGAAMWKAQPHIKALFDIAEQEK